MARTISIAHGADDPVTIDATPSSFHVEADDDSNDVRISWCRDDLRDDPAGYQAVINAWPGTDTVYITVADDDEPLFTGVVTSVSWDHDKVCVEASDMEGPVQPVEMTVVADPADPTGRTARITVDNQGAGPVGVDFGDDDPNETNPGDDTTPTVHAYNPGIFTIVATDADQPTRTVAQVVTIPFPSPENDLTVTITPEPSDASRQVGAVRADNHGNGQVLVAFGDMTSLAVNVGDGTTPSVHAWAIPGSYTVTVTDVDQPWRYVITEVTVPFPL